MEKGGNINVYIKFVHMSKGYEIAILFFDCVGENKIVGARSFSGPEQLPYFLLSSIYLSATVSGWSRKNDSEQDN